MKGCWKFNLGEEHTTERWRKGHEKTSHDWKKLPFLVTFPYQQCMSMISQLILWCPWVLATLTLSPPLRRYIYTNILSWWIFILYFCNFLCLETPFIFLYLMFKTQTHLWKQEDHVLRISITKIVNLSVPSYNPYSTRQNWHIHERRTVNNKMGVQQQGTFLIRIDIQVFQIILSCLWKLTFLNNHILASSRCPDLLPT